MLGETENQFSLTRAALSTSGRRKQFLINSITGKFQIINGTAGVIPGQRGFEKNHGDIQRVFEHSVRLNSRSCRHHRGAD